MHIKKCYKYIIAKYLLQVLKNREILHRLIDVTLFLAKQELPFRGHDEGEISANRGNYVECLKFLATRDKDLKDHLENSTVFRGISTHNFIFSDKIIQVFFKIKGTSNRIQNDLLDSVAKTVRAEIKREISSSTFMSVIVDESTDSSKTSQACVVLRYIKNGKEIVERLVEFRDVTEKRSAHDLCNEIDTVCIYHFIDHFFFKFKVQLNYEY
jgi:Domain of unknown function (DUF4371)